MSLSPDIDRALDAMDRAQSRGPDEVARCHQCGTDFRREKPGSFCLLLEAFGAAAKPEPIGALCSEACARRYLRAHFDIRLPRKPKNRGRRS